MTDQPTADNDILEFALSQRIGGLDGELIEALCEEIIKLRQLLDDLS